MIGANPSDLLEGAQWEHHFPLSRHKYPIQNTLDGIRLLIHPCEPSAYAGYLTKRMVRNAVVE